MCIRDSGYSASVSPYILEQFEKEMGYKFRPEYIIDQGYYNNQSVSYTHLDVYKRQTAHRPQRSGQSSAFQLTQQRLM